MERRRKAQSARRGCNAKRKLCFAAFKSGSVAAAMKLLTEYLDRAVSLERLAAGEQESTFKDQLLDQAAAYRKLAARRADQYGLPPPSPPEISN
jgi:hypothetical protein